MAELETSSGGGSKKKGGIKKGKKLSTRIDLTPMVDLGFLLITFFMYTTTLAKPKSLEIVLPKDTKDTAIQNKIPKSAAMTVLLSKQHRVYYYYGLADDDKNPPTLALTYFKDKKGIRDAIIEHKKKFRIAKQNDPIKLKNFEAMVIIKLDSTSTYKDMIDILDEIEINNIRMYALVDISPVEQTFIRETEIASGENP